MESPFLYKILAGTKIFRAKTINKEGRWYTLSLEDAYSYGENITEYTLLKDLKLINITSLTFHNDYMDRISVLYPGNDYSGYDINKMKCLIPLGLVDLSLQSYEFTSIGGGKIPINETLWNDRLEYLSKSLLNRHRLSEHSLDTNFVSILEKIYGDHFDGYISPIKWPTKIHGHLFPRELFTFKLENIKEESSHIRPVSGGGINNTIKISCNMPDFSKIDYDSIQKNINKEIKEIVSQPLLLFWNPHTEEAFTECKLVYPSLQASDSNTGGKRTHTRKKNKNIIK